MMSIKKQNFFMTKHSYLPQRKAKLKSNHQKMWVNVIILICVNTHPYKSVGYSFAAMKARDINKKNWSWLTPWN